MHLSDVRGGKAVGRHLCGAHGEAEYAADDRMATMIAAVGKAMAAWTAAHAAPPTCEVCSEPPTVHTTERRDGQVVGRHFCQQHAPHPSPVRRFESEALIASGVASPSVNAAVARALAEDLRFTAAFIRRHGRVPTAGESAAESEAVAPAPERAPPAEIEDPHLRETLDFLDRLIEFQQAHGTIPLKSLYLRPPRREPPIT